MDEGMLNDLLECSVCLERLDSTSKVLPCQHTFCKRCLEEIVSSRKELRCPECRILVETKVEDLPCNILLIRILEGMKNAPRFKSQLTVSSSDISGQKNYACISQITTGSPSQSIMKTNLADNRTHTQSKQNFQAQQPSAKALYSYEAKEPGDLSFKKGDIILLRKKIDNNWYHGELDGKHGFFPASYVQVITPLPAHIPQCKALYDFKMNENEEKDCLTFSKGEVITVIRRVDENWAEGKLSDRIGIFPISFVEMNSAARALMKLSMNSQPGPSRIAPPTPSSDSETTPLITNNAGSNFSQQTSSSSTTQSSTSSGSSSSTTPSPSSPPPSSIPVPIPYPRIQSQRQQREKRHSFTVIPQIHSPPQQASHRHSVEIVSPSSPGVAEESTISSIVTSSSSVTTANTCIVQTRSGTSSPANSGSQVTDNSGNLIRRHSNNRKERETSAVVPQNETSSCAANSGSSIPNTHVAVPTFYVAMYQYKPQKEDELELKKGELYTVSEKCQDGWFKGTSLRNGQSGVFPGNYVQIAKSSVLQAHFRQTTSVASVRRSGSLPSSPSQAQGQRPKTSTQQSIRTVAGISSPHSNTNLLVSSSKTQSHNTVISYSRPKSSSPSEKSPSFLDWARSVTSLNPPPKPPRPQSPRSQQQVSPRQSGHRSHNAPELPPRSLSPMTASASGSLGQSSQPLLSPQPPISQSWHGSPSNNNNNNSNSNNSNVSSTTTSSQSRQILQPHSVLSTASAITPPNVSVACSVSQHRNDRTMEKKDKKEKDKVSFVKLLKSKKKSKSPPPSVYSMDNPVFVDCVANTNSPQTVHVRSGSCPGDVVLNVPSSSTVSHKKSNSLDGSSDNSKPPQTRPKQPAPLVRERFRCIVPYPPNSEYEIELKVDDIIYVHKKRDDGWYKGTLQRTGKTGLFPASFVESF